MIRALALLIIALAAAAWWFWPRPEPAAVHVVQPQTAPPVLLEHAVLTSAERTVIRAAIEGSITSIVATGTRV
ncbi:MAG: hypothetical protein ACOCXJ_03160, partial [Planctomycetota bacterium]